MNDVKKAYEITDARIQFVSLVDKAANLKKFLITKAEDGQAAFMTCGRIIKTDTEKHYVTGVVYEPMVEDAHHNYMTEAEIAKAAYWFAKNGNSIDLQHSFEPLKNAAVVESWIAKADFTIGDETVKAGTWLMTVEISDDEIWNKIEKGEITGLSMGGMGIYSEEDVDLGEVKKGSGTEPEQEQEKKGLLKRLAEMFGFNVVEKAETPIVKAGKKMSGANRETLQTAYNALGALLEAVSDTEPESEPAGSGEERGGKDKTDNKKSDNSGGKEQKEEQEMTKAEVEKLVQDSVAEAVAKALEQHQTEANEVEEADIVTKEEVQEMVTKAVSEAVAPLLKARGVPTAMNDGGTGNEQTVEKHYLHGIL